MRLHEHPDFRALVARVAAEQKLPEWWIEKDYYLTEILRTCASSYPEQSVLKGGTSLSKGWALIDRISEDIDVFFDPHSTVPSLGKNAVDHAFKVIAEASAQIPGLALINGSTVKRGGSSRTDTFRYEKLFPDLASPAPTIILESGIQSGRRPEEKRRISSYVGRSLEAGGQAELAEDVRGFDMHTMHYTRTFVEKLFTIHGKVQRFLNDGTTIGRDARHYVDLDLLAQRDDVRAMLSGAGYADMRNDYDAISREFYPKTYRPPDDLRFHDSPALFPDDALRRELSRSYEVDVPPLFLGQPPEFGDVLRRLTEIRELL